MDIKVVLSSEELIKGLKHYRRIAKQDLLSAEESENPERFRNHAEARRHVYSQLTEVAETFGPHDTLKVALDEYKKLPFVTGTEEDAYTDIKGKENALENFFLMVGLEPKVRREIRSQRPSLTAS
ncbi:MAG: hypothetical protein R2880_03255 [Deinococcales bacterium]